MSLGRYFAEMDAERVDDLGFLDPPRSPRLRRYHDLLAGPVGWVLGPPWLGKSTVAAAVRNQLRSQPETLPGVGGRVALTRLGSAGADRDVPPPWWRAWVAEADPRPAVWLVDGADEALDRDRHLLDLVAETLEAAPRGHLGRLRLLLFSRPYAELGGLRDRLQVLYEPLTRRTRLPQYWLTRLDRTAAAALVGPERFAAVEDLIRRNHLQAVAGFPVVLNFLRTYRQQAEALTVAGVWRGVLTALLGEPQSHPGLRFSSDREERFAAAARVAAVLALTRRDAVREWSPDPGEPTVGTLFRSPDNRLLTAAREACRTALFAPSGDPPPFRFAQRNARDWLAAFALAGLPPAALRSALAGGDGRLAAGLQEVARLLRVVSPDPAAHAVIDGLSGGVVLPSDAAEPALAEVVRVLDRLEGLAAASPWGLRVGFDRPEDLARLRAPGLSQVLAGRLRDPGRPARVKRLLTDVAEATASADAVEAAVDLVVDPAQEDELRHDAAWMVARLGGPVHLEALANQVVEGDDDSEIAGRLRGVVIQELIRQGVWPRWRVALHAPPVSPGLIDHRHAILRWVEEGMTLADARQLLPHLRELYHRHAEVHRPHKLHDYLTRAVELALGESPPDPADIDHLVHFVTDVAGDPHGYPAARTVALRLVPFPDARRRLYRHDLGAAQGRRVNALSLLRPGDWRWLRDLAGGERAGDRTVWAHAYRLALDARAAGELSGGEWQAFVRLAEQQAPGLPAEFEAARLRHEQELEEQRAEERAWEARHPRRLPLAARVRNLLARPGLTPPDLMRELGWACFADCTDPGRPPGGGWKDLPADLQCQVLEACRRGLEEGTPTPIPTPGSIPGRTLAEGAAFARVAGSPDHHGWLAPELVCRWLPTALFARTGGDWEGPIAACGAASRAATEAALLETIELHARRDVRPFVLRQIPADWWSGALSDRLAGLVRDETISAAARGELLEQLAERAAERAHPIAAAWATRPVASDESDQLRRAGRNLLLRYDPAGALGLVEADVAARGAAALEELPALWGSPSGLLSRWSDWPLPELERLGRLLLGAYPESRTPAPHNESPTGAAEELRWLRDGLVGALLARPDPDAPAVLDRLAALGPMTRERVESHRANEHAARLLPGVDPAAARDPAALPLRDAVGLLDRAGFRLIRSADDLLDATLEALRAVASGAGHDLPMLYSDPDGSGGRSHLREAALQAYLRRRLADELGRLADGVEVQIVREDQVSRRQRLDLRVTAPCQGTGRLATVVVEVKWSTNDETRTGLVGQLGDRYLLGEGLTHGIFLVGWSGEWRPGDGSGWNPDVGSLVAHLTAQRDGYCRAGQPGEGLRIEPVVLDLRWSRAAE